MIARQGIWSDPEIQKLVERFVPAADEVWLLQTVKGPEGVLFRRVAEKGHYAGRTKPTATRQGTYALTAAGEFLASANTHDPQKMSEMLRRALARWDELPREKRLQAAEPAPDPEERFRWEKRFPRDGLVLRVNSRDLPRPGAAGDDWRARAWNQDYAWFRKDEARQFLPVEPAAGAEHAVPEPLVVRLVRCHLVDNVRGQTSVFPEKAVEKARLVVRILAVDGAVVKLRLEGETRAVERGRWPARGYEDMDAPGEQERGYEARLAGRAAYDLERGAFTSFELVAVGSRWGGTQYNGRSDDLAAAPMGVGFTPAAGDAPVAPAFVWAYGWKK